MRRLTFFVLAVSMGGLALNPNASGDTDSILLRRLSQRYKDLVILNEGSGAPTRFAYADAGGHVHAYEIREGGAVLVWEEMGLGSRVSGLIVGDVDADGRRDIVIATTSGRIMVCDAEKYEKVWENHENALGRIDCITAGNIDDDPQDELILVQESHLVIIDGLTRSQEWRSRREFAATEMILGNVDGDSQLELILNTGVVLDTRFHNVEFESEVQFGRRIDLVDLTGDGIPEVIGETGDLTIRVFDVHTEREVW